MFIQTEATPNPATLKFLPGKTVLEHDVAEFRSSQEAAASPLAERLFDINGVESVFFGSDFITITKGDTEWQTIKPAVLGAIMEHYMSGAPVLNTTTQEADTTHEEFDEADAQIVSAIKDLLESHVRPAVAADGGDIIFQGYRDGVVFLHMRGACAGCPSSTITLKHGIENLLRHFIPDIQEVRPVMV